MKKCSMFNVQPACRAGGFSKKGRPSVLHPFSGFTLIETLVAVTILIASVAAPLTIAQKSLASAIYAKDQTVAFYLAEEAIEFIRAIRDENSYKEGDWLAGLETCLNGVCGISIGSSPGSQIINCRAQNTDCRLKRGDEGLYGTGYGNENRFGNENRYGNGNRDGNGQGWQDTPFTREVTIEEIDPGADREAMIKVTMRWQTGALSARSFTVEEHLFNWRK